MAELAKIKVGSTIYSLKDNEARAAVTALQTAVASSLVFKGVVSSAAEMTELIDYKTGWTYKASATFSIPSIGTLEAGDMIICIKDYSESYNANDWTVVQNNVDIMVGASSNAIGVSGLVPTPAIGDNNKFLCGDGTWNTPAISWGTFSDLN